MKESQKSHHDSHAWGKRYESEETPWDIGYPSPAIMNYARRAIPKDAKILIPGAGNAYEAEALFQEGYTGVTVCDWAEHPIIRFKERVPEFPDEYLLVQDFFELDGGYDFILEQTFLSALPVSMRTAYVEQCHRLLHPGGILAGLLFMIEFDFEGPPFGGKLEEYELLFGSRFHIRTLGPAVDSIKPRLGAECFIECAAK